MIHILKTYRTHLVLLFASVLFASFLTEGFLTVYLLLQYGKVGREELIRARAELRDDIVGGSGNRFENRLVLHPFFGYTYNPKDKGINNFGFPAQYDISFDTSRYSIKDHSRSDSLVIGMFGGSFAELTGKEHAYLEERVKPIFPDKKPIVMNFAVGGHALPQSAFIYLYFQELFDVVVFIDGLNELWNSVENNNAGVPPEYAKAAHYIYKISRQELTPTQFERTSQIISLKRNIDNITWLSLLPIIRQSLFIHAAWKVLHMYWSRRISERSLDIANSYNSTAKFIDTEEDAILNYAAREWRRYHIGIHNLSTMEGVRSFHLLQPNPFVPNSKTLTPQEKKLIENSYPIAPRYVMSGYPKLQAEIANMREQGVIVEDLTNVFKAIDTSIWIDAGHANDKGSRLVMDKIVELIRANKNSITNLRKVEVERR